MAKLNVTISTAQPFEEDKRPTGVKTACLNMQRSRVKIKAAPGICCQYFPRGLVKISTLSPAIRFLLMDKKGKRLKNSHVSF